MDKQELGAFLRSRRERLRPEDVGLPSGPRRRTPGLRREEIAVLAHISTEYYVRLEQGRAPRPSGEVLAGIAGALRLTDAESDHLHVLAGTAPTRTGLHRRDVRPSILALLERLPQTAAFVTSAAFEVLAWNDLAAALMEDFARLAPQDRNLARRAFLGPARPDAPLYGISDAAEFRHHVVLELRATLARYPTDPVVTGPSTNSGTAALSSPGSGSGMTCRRRRRSPRRSGTQSSGKSPSTATPSRSPTATSTSCCTPRRKDPVAPKPWLF